jgi:hypothetical protein
VAVASGQDAHHGLDVFGGRRADLDVLGARQFHV